MNFSLSNLLFPRMCCICKRYDNYICSECKKLLKRNLPECYICRRLSPSYTSHISCKRAHSLNHVFVAWEYNSMSASILKQYKYKGVKDISQVLTPLFIECILKTVFLKDITDTLLVPVPISNLRRNERGFNQMEYITLEIGNFFNLDVSKNLISCKYTDIHQAGKTRSERENPRYNPFYIKDLLDLGKYKSVTLVDDVITTGSTLEKIAKVIKAKYNQEMDVNALCMFRGKPYYLPNSQVQ